MKRIVLFAFTIAAMALAAVSCTKEESNNVAEAKTFVSMEAVFADNADDTRTTLQSDGKSVWWSPREEVNLFYGSVLQGKLISINTEPQAQVTFEGYLNGTPVGNASYWAIYPYDESNACNGSSVTLTVPERQGAKEGTFGEKLFPAIAVSKTQEFAFYNVCGGIQFSVSRNDIKYVTFKGNGNETLAGKVRVEFHANGKPIVAEVFDGQTEITVTAPDGGAFMPGEYYFMTLLPGALDSGFTMSFNTADSKGVIITEKPQTVKRSIFGVLNNVDINVAEWEKVIPTITCAEFIAKADPTTSYRLIGLVSSAVNTAYCSFDLTDDTGTVRIWSVNNKDDWADVVKKGGKVSVYGKYMKYENAGQVKHEMVDAYIESFEEITVNPSDPQGEGTLDSPYNAAGACAYIDSNDYDKDAVVYVKGKISKVSNQFDANYGTARFDLSDDGTLAVTQFTCYSVYYLGNQPWVDGCGNIKAGDDVIVCGKVTLYNGDTYETLVKEAYLYSLNGRTEPEVIYEPTTSGLSSNSPYTLSVNDSDHYQVDLATHADDRWQ